MSAERFVIQGRSKETARWQTAQVCRTRAEAESALWWFKHRAGQPIEGHDRRTYWPFVRLVEEQAQR